MIAEARPVGACGGGARRTMQPSPETPERWTGVLPLNGGKNTHLFFFLCVGLGDLPDQHVPLTLNIPVELLPRPKK